MQGCAWVCAYGVHTHWDKTEEYQLVIELFIVADAQGPRAILRVVSELEDLGAPYLKSGQGVIEVGRGKQGAAGREPDSN